MSGEKMLKTKLLLFVTVVTICCRAYGAAPLTATLTLVPVTVLPALPTAFLVTITNSSNQPQQVFDTATLSVTTAATAYVAEVNGRTEVSLPADQTESCNASRCLNIAPLGTKELYFDFGPSLVGNPFFFEARLSASGTYGLKLTLRTLASDGSEIDLSTQTATLTIQQPQGVDAEALTWLTQQAGTTSAAMNWALRANTIATQLRALFPKSQYANWTAALGGATKEEQLANIDAALGANPPVGLRDTLLFAKGSLLAQWNRVAIYSLRDLQAALTYADAATATLSTLRDSGISNYMRQRATALIDGLYTTKTGQAALRDLAAADPPAPAAVVPRVECVTRGKDQSFTARFGYSNANRALKVLQIGDLNQVTPAPRDQGQPRVFKPGDHSSVFTASSPGGELKWHLDGSQATATADFAVRCSATP
jgi:hypothetical protein